MTKLEMLRKCDVFAALNDEELQQIENICHSEEFAAGTLICKQGSKEEKLYVIEHGTAGIILEVGALAQRQVQAVTDYEAFGWSAMLEPYICTATVKALEKTRVLSFNGQELSAMCSTRPDLGYKVAKGIARVIALRLRQAYIQLLGVTAQI